MTRKSEHKLIIVPQVNLFDGSPSRLFSPILKHLIAVILVRGFEPLDPPILVSFIAGRRFINALNLSVVNREELKLLSSLRSSSCQPDLVAQETCVHISNHSITGQFHVVLSTKTQIDTRLVWTILAYLNLLVIKDRQSRIGP